MKFLAIQFLVLVALAVAQAGIFSFRGQKNFDVFPSHKNYSLMARYIAHNADYTAVAYKSIAKDTFNLSLSTLFSFADGPIENGTGVPYLFLTEHEPAVKEMMATDRKVGLMISLVQTGLCAKNKWDAEDPRCARMFLTGRIEPLANNTAEHEFAKKSFSARHPLFVGMPGFHKFFYAKYDIYSIKMISGVGGIRHVTVKDYFAVKDSKYNLV